MALALYMTFNTWADGLSLRNSRRNLYISHIAAKWMSATESISMSAMATYSNNAVANNSFKPTQLLRMWPNNSFKPSPLRGLGPTGAASGGPA